MLIGSPAAAQTIEEKAQLCSACHGEAGIPQEKTTPVIWGQNEGYLYLQPARLQQGLAQERPDVGYRRRPVEGRYEGAGGLLCQSSRGPNLQQPSAAKDVSKKALTAIGSIGCPSCHLDQLQGDGTTARLAGQQGQY